MQERYSSNHITYGGERLGACPLDGGSLFSSACVMFARFFLSCMGTSTGLVQFQNVHGCLRPAAFRRHDDNL
ncbi:hypothetical protein SeLEV6574_g01329 [Synchytrium endobioticum]|uniref:Uncharacterized protein n=1 Tax=Synchytrium endobioticum TaxID=286115 RepID=A0A507DE35_9FUNG|nr:hypothetical protein SeLEV6574_g01329 [Synchytrium endobioticum]